MSSPPREKGSREKERSSTRRTFTLPGELDQALQELQAEEEARMGGPVALSVVAIRAMREGIKVLRGEGRGGAPGGGARGGGAPGGGAPSSGSQGGPDQGSSASGYGAPGHPAPARGAEDYQGSDSHLLELLEDLPGRVADELLPEIETMIEAVLVELDRGKDRE